MIPKLTPEVLEKIEEILGNKPAPWVRFWPPHLVSCVLLKRGAADYSFRASYAAHIWPHGARPYRQVEGAVIHVVLLVEVRLRMVLSVSRY